MHTLRPYYRFSHLTLLALSLTACTGWQVESVPPQQTLADRYTGKTMRLTTLDNKQVVISRIQVRGDSITGRREGGTTFTAALADLREIATPHFNEGGTLGLVLGPAALAGAAIFIALAAQHDGS